MCSDCVVSADERAAETNSILKFKYYHTYSTYQIFAAQLMGQIPQVPLTPSKNSTFNGCRLAPIWTEVFLVDCLRWPTFRDFFTAIYINNPSLTSVEKLFH